MKNTLAPPAHPLPDPRGPGVGGGGWIKREQIKIKSIKGHGLVCQAASVDLVGLFVFTFLSVVFIVFVFV